MNKNRYDWRGNKAEYSERYGWHLKPTEQRRQERLQEHVAKRKGRVDHKTNRPGKSKQINIHEPLNKEGDIKC